MEDMSSLSAVLDPSNPLLSALTAQSIPHNSYSHPLSSTVDELLANAPLSNPNESHTKNLFFKDKKHGLFLVSVAASTEVNTKELGTLLKLDGKVNLRLADEDTLSEKLGVKKGCVGPLCIMNNAAKDVTLVLDESLLDKELVHSHPMRNDASVSMTPEDMLRFVRGYTEPVVVKFGDPKLGGKVPSSRPEGDKGEIHWTVL
jgi:Ala-tRNA(Pro) deacylase